MHRLSHPSPRAAAPAVAWARSNAPVDYPAAVGVMEWYASEIAAGRQRELVWLLEHPPLYTAGTSAKPQDLLWRDRFAVHKTGRGGQYTYHGPGQRVAYLMLDVKRRTGDVRSFVGLLEAWLIASLADLGVTGETRADRVGIWVRRPEHEAPAEDKIAAIGIRVRRWISLHGISLNVAPELEHFGGIVPCGVTGHGVTSLSALGRTTTMAEVDAALRTTFEAMIAPTISARPPDLRRAAPAEAVPPEAGL